MIKIKGVADASRYPSNLIFGDDQPVEYLARGVNEIFAGPLIILVEGPDKRSCLEITVDRTSLVLVSFAVVLGQIGSESPFGAVDLAAAGLPVVSVPDGPALADASFGACMDCQAPIGLFASNRHFDIGIGAAQTFDRCLSHGRVRFLISGDELVGFRIVDLTDDELRSLEDYIARQAARA